MKRKSIQIAFVTLLTLLLAVSLVPGTAFAVYVVDSGRCGEHLRWSLDSDGELTITGTGEMFNYAFDIHIDSVPWYAKRESVKKVVIESGATSIGDWVFYDCNNLASVEIPNSVTSIGDYAFSKCWRQKNIEIPNSVTSIGRNAFEYCNSLTSITIPNSVTSIGGGAFNGCSSLTSVTIPDSVTSIGDSAFYYCSSLTSVTIPNSVTSIGNRAFLDCRSLTSVTIPDSVTSIGDLAFSNCYSMVSIQVDQGNQQYSSIDGVLFNKNQSILICFPGGKNGAYTPPDSVTSIGRNAFYHCNGLTSITIPNSVTSIEDTAFYSCSSLKDVYYDGTEDKWSTISIGKNNYLVTKATTFHTPGDQMTEVITAPTCTEDGSHDLAVYWTNTQPKEEYSRETVTDAALGHDLAHHAAQASTCTEIGWNTYDDCSRCDYTTYEEIAPLGHDYKSVVSAPTCTEDGYTTHTCTRCNDSYRDAETDAIGHRWGEWIVTTESTYTATGLETRTCQNDPSHVETREIPMLERTNEILAPIRSGGVVEVTVFTEMDTATVYCAVFDKNGKMLEVKTDTFSGEKKETFAFTDTGFDHAKVFLLDDEGKPACESKGI